MRPAQFPYQQSIRNVLITTIHCLFFGVECQLIRFRIIVVRFQNNTPFCFCGFLDVATFSNFLYSRGKFPAQMMSLYILRFYNFTPLKINYIKLCSTFLLSKMTDLIQGDPYKIILSNWILHIKFNYSL